MRVLLVEDEPDIRLPLQRALLAQGFEVRVAHDLPSGREAMLEIEPDLMVLDVRLLDEEDGGFILAREARASGYSGSILFLTARDALQDRVQALDDGGDDYVVKPFELLEVLARVRALLRRPTEARSSQLRFGNTVGSSVGNSVGNLELDLVRQQVSQSGIRLELSVREFALLERLALTPSRVFSAEELLDAIWGESASSISVVKVNVHRLREKLGAETISSVRGGYQFGLEPARDSSSEST
jgi:two-component system, OmpR family, response regulator QseB